MLPITAAPAPQASPQAAPPARPVPAIHGKTISPRRLALVLALAAAVGGPTAAPAKSPIQPPPASLKSKKGHANKSEGAAESAEPAEPEDPPEVRLGERLFLDTRFSSPKAEKRFSCRTCHLVHEFVESDKTMRAYVDYDKRSPIPIRKEDAAHTVELRNSPTMIDSSHMARLHDDGEFGSLEELTMTTLKGRNMGWIDGEQEAALDNAYKVLLTDKAEGLGAEGTYVEQFKAVYSVDLKAMNRDEAIEIIARSMADYMRSLDCERTSPYDAFLKANELASEPTEGESPEPYAAGLLAAIGGPVEAEAKKDLKFVDGFGAEELRGMRIFFAQSDAGKKEPKSRFGACASCHAPPFFTDFSFHNTGVSQFEYDAAHGEGAFAKLKIPAAADAQRPNASLRAIPDKARPGEVDLGHWNFVDLNNSPLRREGESEDALLARTVAAFKTPTLRDLKFTEPYMHNGGKATVRDAVAEYVRVGGREPAAAVVNRDPKLANVFIDAKDIDPLVAFLNALNENYE